jgi:hypothetical protein
MTPLRATTSFPFRQAFVSEGRCQVVTSGESLRSILNKLSAVAVLRAFVNRRNHTILPFILTKWFQKFIAMFGTVRTAAGYRLVKLPQSHMEGNIPFRPAATLQVRSSCRSDAACSDFVGVTHCSAGSGSPGVITRAFAFAG